MRVALVHRDLDLGGSLSRDRVLLARALTARGVEVHLYANPDSRTVDVPGAVLHDVRPLLSSPGRFAHPIECASFAAAATRALRRDRGCYDVVDVSGTSAWEHDVVRVHAVQRAEQRRWPQEAGRHYRAARLRAAVASVSYPIVGLARGIERLQFRPGRFRRVAAVTDRVRDDLVEVHGVPARLVDVVPYPVELERFETAEPGALRGTLGLVREDPLVLFVGHDFERKGLAEAVEGVAAVPGAHLAVVGNGSRARYVAAAARAGAAERVHFVGPTEEPERLLADADVFLLPTRNDVWAIAVVEALAASVPVVTTEAAGAARVVRDADAGIVLSDGSPDGIAGAVGNLVERPDLRRELGARGPAAAAPYGVHAFGERMLEVYERVRAALPARTGPVPAEVGS